MPHGRGTALDVFERAARRGVDVRLIFWRPDDEMAKHRRNAFWGSKDHFDMLSQHYHHINIRWDRAAPGYCQHQKTWLIDVNEDTATSFVGGINLNPNSLALPGHSGSEEQNHDVYIELNGPAVADVHHNFVQRWNEASERNREDGLWGDKSTDDLMFPHRTPAECGTAQVQIQRTTHRGRYVNGHPPQSGSQFDIASGERTNLDQYCAAIGTATRTIYLENQYVEVAPIVVALDEALKRGVEVVLLLPAVPDFALGNTITDERKAFLDLRASLSSYGNFTLVGIAALGADGQRKPVYVHSKLLLIDDELASIGSCNLHHHSLYGNGELNAAIQDPDAVRAIRIELFREHLSEDTSPMDDTSALQLFKQIARKNRELHECGDPHWQGLVFSLNAQTYGQHDQF